MTASLLLAATVPLATLVSLVVAPVVVPSGFTRLATRLVTAVAPATVVPSAFTSAAL